MIKKIFSKAFSAIIFFSAIAMVAQQHFQTMPVQSGYTADVIANGLGSSMSSTTVSVDGTYYNLVTNDFKLTPTSTPPSYGLPATGIINSAISPGLSFQLGNLSGNNSLRLQSNVPGAIDNSGTLVFANPVAAVKIYMLATSGQGTSYVTITVNFTDNTTQSFIQEIPFWNSTRTNYAIRGIGRINRDTDVLQYYPQDPKLYETVHNISAANQTKPIKSITVTKGSNEGVANIFAFSADAYTDCVEPVLQPAGMITSNSAQISWTVPAGTSAISHDIYYSTSSTPPTSTTVPNYSGVTGTSYTLGSLLANTKYYYWVRTNCSGLMSQSQWSLSKNFTTLCGVMVLPYTYDFNSFGSTNIITCWTKNLSGGTPATGPTGTDYGWYKGIFLNDEQSSNSSAKFNMGSANKIAWLTTPLFDLSTGAYKVKFNYGIKGATSSLPVLMGGDDVVHFLLSNDSGNTWTILKTWDINNNPSNTSSEYFYNFTTSASPTTKFAFYANTGTTNNPIDYGFFVDDFTVESIAQLGTSEVNNQSKKVIIYPNPFKDILYLSDTEDLKKVTVADVSGRILKTIDNPEKELNLSELKAGVYLVTILFTDGSKSTVKAIKE